MSPALERRGVGLVVTAPSGAGKTTVTRKLIALEPALALSISVTTRRPRPGEREGVHYYYRDREAFCRLAEGGALLEWAEVYGQGYGTPRAAVEASFAAGRDVAFDIDWQGWRQLRRAMPDDMVGVFLLPPSASALRERLVGRAGDSEADIARRLAAADEDLSHWNEYDYVLVNDDLEACVAALRSILAAARLARSRQAGLAAFVESLQARPRLG